MIKTMSVFTKSNSVLLNRIWALILLVFVVFYFFDPLFFHFKEFFIILATWILVWMLINFN